MMGAMDPHYYILLALAVNLEMWLGLGAALLNPFIFRGGLWSRSRWDEGLVSKIIKDNNV
jgi:hypothetical protein